MRHILLLSVVCAFALLVCIPGIGSAQIANHVVISEVYGGGGNSGAYWTNDFIELYNPTSSPVSLTGWSVQYISATGTGTWAVTNLSGTIAAHGFYLVQQAQGAGGTQPLPTPDATGTIAMASGAGKVALVNTTTALTGGNPSSDPSVIDFVGYGSTATGFEGSGPTPTLTNTTSAERKAKFNSTIDSMYTGGADTLRGNGWDANDNAADFVIRGAIAGHVPDPQNSASPLEVPPVIGNIPPIIGSITRSFFVAEVSGVDTIKVNVTDPDGTVSGVKLNIKVNGGTVDSSISMTLGSGTQYVGIIPASKHTAAGNLIEYWVSATDNSGGYSTTASTPIGYFVGDAPIATIKSYTTTAVNGYAARVNGTLNVATNLFASGQGFIQDATAGLQIFKSGGLTQFSEGRNVKVQGSLVPFAGAFELQDPGFAFVDTTLGTSTVTPITVTLPINQSPQYVNEGRLVKVVGMSTDSTGTFAASRNYNYREADNDTITVRVESNASANNLVGKTIPTTPIDVIGILSFQNTNQRIKPRKDTDMGIAGGDGTGTAAITPTFSFAGTSALAETLTVTGNGVNTLEGVSMTIPASWTWDGTSRTLGGAGFSGAVSAVTGSGTSVDPWVITVTGAAVTAANPGVLRVFNLAAPSALGLTTWTTKTRIASGTFANVATQPTVNIVSAFEAVTSGNWSSPATWSSGSVPTATDNVTMSTLNVTVTIDVVNAVCNNLTLTGSGSASNSGPLLQFAASGPSQLTVNGNLAISGGSGGGSGDRGGRAKLSSNGNTSAVLIVKRNVTASSSNTVANGSAGLNMNEGTVKLTGATADTIFVGAGHRLGNLEIGDGTSAKTVSTAISVTTATMAVKSITVKQNSTFWIGTATNVNVLTIGSLAAGVVTLNGGITVESGASLKTINSSAGEVIAPINLFGGGITNNGTIDLLISTLHPLTHCHYNVNIDSTDQAISGSQNGLYADMTVGAGRTLTLNHSITVADGFKLTLNGTLVESAGKVVVGAVTTTRNVAASSLETFGGIGLTMNTSTTAPGSTVVTRVTGVPSTGGTNTSILRYFDIAPTVNTGLGATMQYFYDNTELAGQAASTLQLWRSPDAGATWTAAGGTVDTSLHRIQLAGVNDFSRWTASDAAHPLGGSGTVTVNVSVAAGWNLISNPVKVSVPDDSAKHLFPTISSRVFSFSNGYVAGDRMIHGKGYWGKFPGAAVASITGTITYPDSVPVVAGWNLVGSAGCLLDTSTITTWPIGIRASNWFGFSGGYLPVSQLTPGKAFWVKSLASGWMIFYCGSTARPAKSEASVSPVNALNSLTITDSKGNSQTLYFGADANNAIDVSMFAMPPAPPAGALDARFETADGGSMVQTHAAKVTGDVEFPVKLQSDAYPLTVSWNVSGTASYVLTDGQSGKAFRMQEMSGTGSYKITGSNVERITVKLVGNGELPKEFSLSQNYPNPFNPSTSVKYALPVDSKVTVEIYNLVGQRVRTLVSDNLTAGYHIAEWDGLNGAGQQLASGVYFLQMSAKGVNGQSFSELRKLMMLK